MKELQDYRSEIDEIDKEIMKCLARRFEIIRAVGYLKAEKNIEVVQSKRAEEVINRAMQAARENNVDPDLVGNFYKAMIDIAHIIENQIKEEQASRGQ
ncbi:MAG: chorismate mutase [Alphaproteobacteria bacterium]